MLKSIFCVAKIANSLSIGHQQKRSLRFKFAIVAGPTGGAHSGPSDLLAGSRERAPKGAEGKGGVRKGDEGEG